MWVKSSIKLLSSIIATGGAKIGQIAIRAAKVGAIRAVEKPLVKSVQAAISRGGFAIGLAVNDSPLLQKAKAMGVAVCRTAEAQCNKINQAVKSYKRPKVVKVKSPLRRRARRMVKVLVVSGLTGTVIASVVNGPQKVKRGFMDMCVEVVVKMCRWLRERIGVVCGWIPFFRPKSVPVKAVTAVAKRSPLFTLVWLCRARIQGAYKALRRKIKRYASDT